MLVIFENGIDLDIGEPNEEIVPIVWNFDPNLLIGEAAVTFEGERILAEVNLFEEFAPDWFIGMLHDCPDVWGYTYEDHGDIFMIGVCPPTETDLTMLVIEKLSEFRERQTG